MEIILYTFLIVSASWIKIGNAFYKQTSRKQADSEVKGTLVNPLYVYQSKSFVKANNFGRDFDT